MMKNRPGKLVKVFRIGYHFLPEHCATRIVMFELLARTTLCFKSPTLPFSVGAAPPPGPPFATATPLATSTWTSPNGIPFGGYSICT